MCLCVSGIFCGSVLPGPVLLNNSHNATLLFSSDVSRAGSGFVIRHHAVKGHSHPGGKYNIHCKHTRAHCAIQIIHYTAGRVMHALRTQLIHNFSFCCVCGLWFL